MPKKIKSIQSLTTPNHHMQLRSWLAELVMVRSTNGRLPEYFWRDTRWKWRYGNEVKAVTKFIKKYGESVVVKVVCNNPVKSFTDYAELEFLLQKEYEAKQRLAIPKDTTPVMNEERRDLTDLREPRSVVSRKNLFERLSEIEGGSNG
jgi:hypothetical protein